MYLEYLTDRIGGPGVFQAIELGKPNAWSNPAVVKALSDIQQLARAGAFPWPRARRDGGLAHDREDFTTA
jgi:hypothetical protein